MVFIPESLYAKLAHIRDVKRYVVAFSGGIDSHVLLHALTQLRDLKNNFPIIEVLHIHHGVSEHADSWVEHCKQVCDSAELGLSVRYVKANPLEASLENSLRKARYGVFEEFIKTGDLLLLAHHANDQAETILFKLLRGSGAQGASGIAETRSLGKGRIHRPLLAYSRDALEAYAHENDLSWIEDESNSDIGYDRNFLRHEVVPKLTERWPKYQQSVARFAAINAQLQKTVNYFIERELLSGLDGECLNIDWLLSYEIEVQIELLRGWLQYLNLPIPGYQQLCRIKTEVIEAFDDAQPVLSWSGTEIRRFRGKLYAMKSLPAFSSDQHFSWDIEKSLNLSGAGELSLTKKSENRGLSSEVLAKPLTVRFRQGGERCRPSDRSTSRSLKKLLQEYHVPPWLRDRLPLIYDEENLVAVADLWICEGFAAKDSGEGFTIHWQRP